MKKQCFLMVLILFLVFPIQPVKADLVMVGQVVAVIEGDIMKVLWPGGIAMVRLSEVDAPERDQAFWEDAKWFAADMTIGRNVIIHLKKDDPFGRKWGEVFLEDGKNLSEALLEAGLAWLRRDYSDDAKLKSLEETARKKKAGLWKAQNPTPPWQFIRGQ